MSDKGQIKFFKCSYYFWLVLFICMQIAELLLIANLFYLKDWVSTSMGIESHQSFSVTQFNGTSFKGTLSMCEEGCEGSYKANMKDWCEYSKKSENLPAGSICQLFTSLFYSNFILTIFLGLSSTLISLLIICIIIYLWKRKFQWLGYCSSCMSFVLIFAGGVFWALINGVSTNNSCKEFPGNGQKIHICIEEGPLALLILILVALLFVLIYTIVMLNFERKAEILREKEEMREISVLGNSTAGLYDAVNLGAPRTTDNSPQISNGRLKSGFEDESNGTTRFLHKPLGSIDDPGLVIETNTPQADNQHL